MSTQFNLTFIWASLMVMFYLCGGFILGLTYVDFSKEWIRKNKKKFWVFILIYPITSMLFIKAAHVYGRIVYSFFG